MFNHACYLQSQFLSVLVTVLEAFTQIPLGLCSIPSWRVWREEPCGLREEGCSLASVLQPRLVKVNCSFSVIPTFLPSPFLCLLPWWLDATADCVELTTLPGRAVQGTLHSFSPPPPSTGSSSCKGLFLCFSQSTTLRWGFWRVVPFMS